MMVGRKSVSGSRSEERGREEALISLMKSTHVWALAFPCRQDGWLNQCRVHEWSVSWTQIAQICPKHAFKLSLISWFISKHTGLKLPSRCPGEDATLNSFWDEYGTRVELKKRTTRTLRTVHALQLYFPIKLCLQTMSIMFDVSSTHSLWLVKPSSCQVKMLTEGFNYHLWGPL